MATPSILCSTCKNVFGSQPPVPEKDRTYKIHHRLFHNFYEAVQQECFICITTWKYMGETSQTTWLSKIGFWQALHYSLYQREDEVELVILEIFCSDPKSEATRRIKFRIVPFEGVEFGKKFSIAEIGPDTSSSASLGLAYRWYISCRACHKQCNRFVNRPRWQPSRLLDIGIEGDTEWKLRIHSKDGYSSPNYMTLSYRWGLSQSFLLTHLTFKAFRRGNPICDLPRTFRDAIFVAWRFSIRYLWIDSLCIIQDSQEDWQIESSMMRDVYTNSSCNISATASVDPQGGLFRPRHGFDVQPGVLKTSATDSTEQWYFIYDKSYWDRQVSNTILHRRGWVFQERLLAPRVLHFTEKQIFWECFRDQKCEGFPLGIPFYSPLKDFAPLFDPMQSTLSLHAFNLWNGIVQEYSECVLTIPSDKLIALLGLARLFQKMTGDEYIAGLWRSRLSEFLDWRVYEPARRLSSDYQAPSWSWASLDGPVRPAGVAACDVDLISIKEIQVAYSPLDYTGQVLSGFITLEGLLVEAMYHGTGARGPICKLKTVFEDISASVWEDALGTVFENHREMHCLALRCKPIGSRSVPEGFSLIGLLLEPLLGSSHDYTRIGHFQISNRDNIEKFGISISEEEGSIA